MIYQLSWPGDYPGAFVLYFVQDYEIFQSIPVRL